MLSEEQSEVLRILERGHNVFVTGPGGSGKSFLIEAIRERFGSGVVVTATTGMAAVQIGGTTLHRFLAMPIGPASDMTETVRRIERMFQVRRRIEGVRILVIDECSMLSPVDFAKADAIMRGVRRGSRGAFGGAQIVMLGDFFQLPPVSSDRAEPRFIFQTPLWREMLGKPWEARVVELRGSYRHADDPQYSEMLVRIREGAATLEDCEALRSRVCKPPPGMRPRPTILLPLVNEVAAVNNEMLRRVTAADATSTLLKPIVGQFVNSDVSDAELEAERVAFLRDCGLDEPVELRVGASVMITANVDDEHVNGLRGIVESLEVPQPEQRAHDLRQMHSFQHSLEFKRRPDTRPEDCPSAAYEPMGLMSVTVRLENGEVWDVPWYRRMRELSGGRGEIYAWIPPVKTAFAMTIHKGQGQTLQTVRISMRRIFEAGQAYVALSRCRTLAGVYLEDFDPSKIFADRAVVAFYRHLREYRESAPSTQRAKKRSREASSAASASAGDPEDDEIARELEAMEREFESSDSD